MDKNLRQILLRWIPVAANMLLIFFFSSQTGETSGELSGFVAAVIGKVPLMGAALQIINIRKLAHFSIYLLLGVLTERAVMLHSGRQNIRFGAALLICFLYACSDEFHQSFVPGRGPSFRDVVIDTTGALAGIVGVMKVYMVPLSRNRSKRR